MKKSPSSIVSFFEKTKNCCKTFLSSCCDYDSRKTNSKPSILAHRYQSMPEPELANPFFKILNKQRLEPEAILYQHRAINNAEFLKKLKLQTTGLASYEAPVPLSSLQIEKQKNAISKIIYNPELTPPPSPTLRSMAPSPEPENPLRQDLKKIEDLFKDLDPALGDTTESESDARLTELDTIKNLYEIERGLINRIREPLILRTVARKLSEIDANQIYAV